MADWNPFKKPETNPDAAAAANGGAPEKTPAELIAEAVSAAIKPLVDANSSLSTRMDEIANSTRKPAPKAEPIEVPSVFDNEDAAFATRVGPLAQRQLETEARITLSEVKQEYVAQGYGEMWTKLENEIKQTLEGSPLIDGSGKLLRGDPTYIRNVVDMQFGREARKSGVKFGGKDRGFFIESASGASGDIATGPVEDGLTDGQRKVFRRMGVTPDDAKKSIAKLKFIN